MLIQDKNLGGMHPKGPSFHHVWGTHVPQNMKGESSSLQSTFSLKRIVYKKHLEASYCEEALDRHRDFLTS